MLPRVILRLPSEASVISMNERLELPYDGWPPALRAAPEEFVSWAQQQLLLEQNESTPTKPLYHYTGEQALNGILAEQRIWCFSHLHQRDRTEFEYSLAIARRVITKLGGNEDFFIKHFCGCLDDLLDNNSFTEAFEFYLFSLSRHRDDRQQWEEYGDAARGFAIGFAPALFQPDRNELNEQANENVHVGRVIYGDAATEIRHHRGIERAAEITSRVGHANIDAIRRVGPAAYLRGVALEVIASQLIWNCLTAKNVKYENEREVRYLIMNMRGKFDAHRRSHRGKHYAETPLSLKEPGSIVEVLVGPLAATHAEATVAEILKKNNYPEGIPIRRSSFSK